MVAREACHETFYVWSFIKAFKKRKPNVMNLQQVEVSWFLKYGRTSFNLFWQELPAVRQNTSK